MSFSGTRRIALLLAFIPSLAQASRSRIKMTECEVEKGFAAALRGAYGDQINATGARLILLDRKTGRILCQASHQAHKIFYPASSIKTLIAFAVLKKVDRKEVNLNELLTINQRNSEAEAEFWGPDYAPGKKVSVRKLLTDMIVVSNNAATNQLIDLARREYINQTAVQLGLPGLQVHRKLDTGSVPAEDPQPPRKNEALPHDLAQLYVELSSPVGTTLSALSRTFLLELLGDQSFHDRLDKDFPPDVKFFHKPGNTSQVAADAGFFYFGPKNEKVAVIAALQEFPSYEPLQKLGKATLDLVLATSFRGTAR